MDFWLILAFILGFLACLGVNWAIKRQARRLVLSQYGAKGVQAKKDAAEDLFSFIADMKLGWDANKTAGGDIKSFATKELPRILMAHPTTAMKFGTRLYKLVGEGSDLEGLTELLGGVASAEA